MRTVTKENLIAQIDRLRKIKDEQGQLSMSSEYTLQAYEMLLATMDSEPDCKERKLFCSTDTARMRKVISASAGTKGTPLYRHAEQPVTQDEREAFEAFMAKRFGDLVDQRRAKNGDQGYMAWDMVVAWTVWQARATMLNQK